MGGSEFWSAQIVARFNLAYNAGILTNLGLGYTVGLDHLLDNREMALSFIPFSPKLTTRMTLIWTRHAPMSRTAQKFLTIFQQQNPSPATWRLTQTTSRCADWGDVICWLFIQAMIESDSGYNSFFCKSHADDPIITIKNPRLTAIYGGNSLISMLPTPKFWETAKKSIYFNQDHSPIR